MSGIKLVGDWARLEKNLNRLKKMSFLALHKEIGEQLLTNTKERFRKQVDPDGKPWAKSFRAVQEKGKTLMDKRELYNSLSFKAKPDRVDVGTNKIYAATHQEGAVIKPRKAKYLKFKFNGSFRTVKKVKIPARPFMGINRNDRQDIEEIIRERIEEILR
jgi:phage virion morphogenesis protein